jgi:hypothetical protein
MENNIVWVCTILKLNECDCSSVMRAPAPRKISRIELFKTEEEARLFGINHCAKWNTHNDEDDYDSVPYCIYEYYSYDLGHGNI